MNSIQIATTSTQLMGQDRRKSMRVKAAVQLELRVQDSEVPIRLQTADISMGGFYVEMSVTLPIGTRVKATLWLGEKTIIGTGIVVTCHPQFGNGVELTAVSAQDQVVLATFLDAATSEAPAPTIQ